MTAELTKWSGAEGLPDFSNIQVDDFLPSIKDYLADKREITNRIVANEAKPDFENTFLEEMLQDTRQNSPISVFYQLAGNHTNESLQAIEAEVGQLLSQHSSWLLANKDYFQRIDAVYKALPDLNLKSDAHRLVEETWTQLVKSGARLNDKDQKRLADINARLSELGTKFGQNVLASEQDFALIVEDVNELSGVPAGVLSAMSAAAKERNHDDGYAITLARSIIEPFLTFADNRDLREQAFKAWVSRGEVSKAAPEEEKKKDNRPIIEEMVRLRAQKAELLGYPTFAAFKLDKFTMAKTPEAVYDLLLPVWEKAKEKALKERQEIQDHLQRQGLNHRIEPWDWRYLQEKVRADKYDLDDAAVKPYLQLENMIQAAFDTATNLFGISFKRLDASLYHPDVRLYEVLNASGQRIALFTGDYFARSSKRSGAWMSAYQSQHKVGEGQIPIITNTMNFAKPPEGEPALLSFDDARTLFHEFGHALHGMLSDVNYPGQSGTAVARDFVELPSQLFEHWLSEPQVLSKYARHIETGETIPEDLLDKMLAASRFNAGFATTEFTASALIDMAFHSLSVEETEDLDPMAFQAETLAKLGMPDEIVMRHASPHFLHVFAGDGYSAGYYSYMWSEVLDADAFQAFKEAGDPFDKQVASKLFEHIYAAGGAVDAEETYKRFRGQMPSPEAMIKKKGLA